MPGVDTAPPGVHAPVGYTSLQIPAGRGVCRADCADSLGTALARATLFDWATSCPDRRELQGRGVAYAVTLPGCGDVVVRHSRHGGLLAPITRDLFLAPTRAPHELAASLRLRDAGVPTPEMIVWLTYEAGPFFQRADVATRLVPGGRDLADVLRSRERAYGSDAPWLAATAKLLVSLARAGARHPDLNIKNVLLAPTVEKSAPAAYVLDVDVVEFPDRATRAQIAEMNWARFERSLHKWERKYALPIRTDEIVALRTRALDVA